MTAAFAAQPAGLVLPSAFPDGVFEAVKDRIFKQSARRFAVMGAARGQP